MPSELRLSVTLAVWLGLRRGEILGLQRADVDLVTRSVRVERASHELSGGQPELGPPKTEAAPVLCTSRWWRAPVPRWPS